MPKVIERCEPSSVVGTFKCTGGGHPVLSHQSNVVKACGSTLEISLHQLFRTKDYDTCAGPNGYVTFMCPVCGVETDISGGQYQVEAANLRSKEEYVRILQAEKDMHLRQ